MRFEDDETFADASCTCSCQSIYIKHELLSHVPKIFVDISSESNHVTQHTLPLTL